MNWMDDTVTDQHRARFEQSLEAIKAKYPELWEEAQKKFAKKTQ